MGPGENGSQEYFFACWCCLHVAFEYWYPFLQIGMSKFNDNLTLYAPMDSSVWFDTINLRGHIQIAFLSLKIIFALAIV